MAVIPQGSGGGGGSDIEPGIYRALVKDVSDMQQVSEEWDGVVRERTIFYITYEVIASVDGDDEWEGEELRQRLTASMNKNSKLLPIARAILGQPDLPEYYLLDTDDLKGKTCLINVVLGKPRNDGGFWRNVDGVMPAKSKKAKKPIEPATDADFEDEDAA